MRIAIVLGTLGAAVSACAAEEVVGPWTADDAPVSATEVVGGGTIWASLGQTPDPVSINDAFSAFPIIEDGFANGAAGVTIEMTFGTPVVNGAGDDLVVFDSRFSVNSYQFAT